MEAVALSRGVMEEDTAAKTDSVRGLSTRGDMHECDPAIARTSVGVATCLLTAIYICRYKCSFIGDCITTDFMNTLVPVPSFSSDKNEGSIWREGLHGLMS